MMAIVYKKTDGADALLHRDFRDMDGYGTFAVKEMLIDTDNPHIVELYGDFLLFPKKPRFPRGFRLADTKIELYFPVVPRGLLDMTPGEVLHADWLCWWCDEIPDWWVFEE